MHISKSDLLKTERIKRLNIINAVSGIKPANLVGTVCSQQKTNLAIFSSVVHLGSNPALLGLISRPGKTVRRHTLENILETKHYTINHVHPAIMERAHFTAAKFEKEQSEFEHCSLTEEFLFDFPAPFVKESCLKIGMQFLEAVPVKANGTLFVIGEINHIVIPDEAINEQGHIDLGTTASLGLAGLNHYYQLEKIAAFPYARTNELPDFNLK